MAFDRNLEDDGVTLLIVSLADDSSLFFSLLVLVAFLNTNGETPGVSPTGDATSKHPGVSTYGGFTFINDTK
jgi:hypothetical protein